MAGRRRPGAGVRPQLADSGSEEDTLLFEADELQHEGMLDHGKGNDGNATGGDLSPLTVNDAAPLRTPSPLVDPPAAMQQLEELFAPLIDPFEPLQATLHDLSHSLLIRPIIITLD